MKKETKQIILFIIICLASCFADNLMAQQIKADASGNYYQVKSSKTSESKSKQTGKTYTDSKGVTYPIWESVNGKLYVIRISKETGKEYKQYLKID